MNNDDLIEMFDFLGVMRRKRAGGEGFQPLNTEEDYEDKL